MMNRLLVVVLTAGSVLLVTPARAPAQTTDWAGYVTLSGGSQATSTNFTEARTFDRFIEQASITSDYSVNAGPTFDLGGGVRIWRDLGFGLSLARYRDEGSISFRARLPHPFFFNQFREVRGEVAGDRRELSAHFDAIYMIRPAERLRVVIFGGPSLFLVDQTLVTDLDITDNYPYDVVTLRAPVLSVESATHMGFNVGTDVMFLVARRLGIGTLIRFSRASVNFEPEANRVISVDVGGLQTSVGLRVLF